MLGSPRVSAKVDINCIFFQASPGFMFSPNGLPIFCTHLSKRTHNRRHIKQVSSISCVLQRKNKGMLADVEKKRTQKSLRNTYDR